MIIVRSFLAATTIEKNDDSNTRKVTKYAYITTMEIIYKSNWETKQRGLGLDRQCLIKREVQVL